LELRLLKRKPTLNNEITDFKPKAALIKNRLLPFAEVSMGYWRKKHRERNGQQAFSNRLPQGGGMEAAKSKVEMISKTDKKLNSPDIPQQSAWISSLDCSPGASFLCLWSKRRPPS